MANVEGNLSLCLIFNFKQMFGTEKLEKCLRHYPRYNEKIFHQAKLQCHRKYVEGVVQEPL